MLYVICFVAGLVVGGVIGVFAMAFASVGRNNHR